jgi:hypothetical protein
MRRFGVALGVAVTATAPDAIPVTNTTRRNAAVTCRELLVTLDLSRPAIVSMLARESDEVSLKTYLQVRHPVFTFTLPLRE